MKVPFLSGGCLALTLLALSNQQAVGEEVKLFDFEESDFDLEGRALSEEDDSEDRLLGGFEEFEGSNLAEEESTGQGRSLRRRPRVCGKRLNRCARVRGRCMGKGQCVKLDRGKNILRWISHHTFCKATDGEKASERCGCCYRRRSVKYEPKNLMSKELKFEARGAGIAALVEKNEEAPRTLFSYQVKKDYISNIAALGEGGDGNLWSFNSHGNSAARTKCSESSCFATMNGYAHSALVDKLMPPGTFHNDSHGEFDSELIPATVEIILMSESKDELRDFEEGKSKKDTLEISGHIDAVIRTIPTSKQLSYGIEPVEVSLSLSSSTQWEYTPIQTLEPVLTWPIVLKERKRSLCIQPVRVRHRTCTFRFLGICFAWSYQYSGAGLNFGRPQMDSQWAKVDIFFNYKSWKTIIDNAGKYKTVSEAEMGDLRSEIVNDPSCIEIFFVPKFTNALHNSWGGGATWGSGTANAQIVSSDAMVSCGVDITHLAHEAGHVLGLKHPGSAGAGSTGTLACPSGWQRDNPRRNSKFNGDNAANPLLISYWGTWTFDTHDCVNDADCGACVLPPDSC